MPGLAGAMRAAVDRARLHAMTAYPDPAVVAGGSKGVRCALEAVKGVRISPGHNYLEGLVVLVATNLTLSHYYSPLSPYRTWKRTRQYACTAKKGLIRYPKPFAVPSIVPRMEVLVIQTLASQLFSNDAGVVCIALTAASRKPGEGLPRSASALKQQVPWMPPVNYPEGHFLALIIASNALEDLRFLNRFVAPRGRVSNLHFCLSPFSNWRLYDTFAASLTVDEGVCGVNPL